MFLARTSKVPYSQELVYPKDEPGIAGDQHITSAQQLRIGAGITVGCGRIWGAFELSGTFGRAALGEETLAGQYWEETLIGRREGFGRTFSGQADVGGGDSASSEQ